MVWPRVIVSGFSGEVPVPLAAVLVGESPTGGVVSWLNGVAPATQNVFSETNGVQIALQPRRSRPLAPLTPVATTLSKNGA